MNKAYVLLVIISCAGVLLLAGTTPTGAWFSETEVIEGITITTGSWSDAGSLIVTADQALLKPPAGNHAKTVLSGITASNTGSEPLEVTGIRVSWDPDGGETIRQAAFTRGKGGEAPRAGPHGAGSDPGSAGGEGFTAFWSGKRHPARSSTAGFCWTRQHKMIPHEESCSRLTRTWRGRPLCVPLILDDESEKEVRVRL